MSGRRLISGKQALDVEMDLRQGLYSHFVRLSFGFYDRNQTGQLMSRATVDLQGVRFFLGYGLIFFFQNVLTVVSVTVVLFFLEWQLALVVLAVMPFLVAIAYRYSHVAHPTLRDVQQKLADVATVAEENIVGVHVVKAFAQEPAEEAKFAVRNEALFAQTIRANRQRATYVPLLSFLPLLAQAAVLLVGARMVAHGSLSVGSFVAFNFFLAHARHAAPLARDVGRPGPARDGVGRADLPDPRRAGGRRRRARRGRAARRATARSASRTSRSRTCPAGRCSSTSTSTLDAGTTVALIGHTGSGKTTLSSLVPRFYDVDSGRVLVDGVDVRDVTLASLRREIGVIAQDPFLFSTTVRDNIAFGRPELTDDEIERVARLAQAHEFVERLPQGYDTVIGERGITLSGGQRQRIAIARALAVDPRILILDDATASVDATTEARIRAGLREVMSGRTTLIIAHRLSTIALADEIVVLDERPDRLPRHARGAARDERRLPRDPRPRPARAPVRRRRRGARGRGGGRLMRVHQAGSIIARRTADEGRGLVVEHDAPAARRPLAADEAVPLPHLPLGLLAARRDGDRARASAPREVRARRRDQRHDRAPSSPSSWSSSSSSRWRTGA